jgi:hypothetical protein
MKTKQIKITVGIYFLLIGALALILGSCASSGHACDAYGKNSINNPDNEEFVVEVAFNERITPKKVTQEMFDKRYLKTKI